ncbi:MAG: adaptor protein MecA [Defluviitaleaceae bacterium]|nr:adaptor protein MecA [Defluviitaleaceae bacterium]
MKIERISSNEIKFILTESDLSERNMRLNELSYGSEKTQELFKEIMERAAVECDFHTTQETPLIIEAIPMGRDSIMIIVTKVGSHEDLEDRFGYPPILGNYKNMRAKQKKKQPDTQEQGNIVNEGLKGFLSNAKQIIFEFKSLDDVTSACARISGIYIGNNALYKYSGKYYLVIENNEEQRITASQESIFKEYGSKFSHLEISKMFLVEHGEVVVEKDAIDVIVNILG